MTKTSTKRKAISKREEPLIVKGWAPQVKNSKLFFDLFQAEREAYIKDLENQIDKTQFKLEDIENEVDRLNSKKTIKLDEVGVDNNPGIDVPLQLQGGQWKWNFEKEPMPLVDKVTWVLTAVNVAILITLFISNYQKMQAPEENANSLLKSDVVYECGVGLDKLCVMGR